MSEEAGNGDVAEGIGGWDVDQERYLELFESLVERDPSGVLTPQLDSVLRGEDEEAHFGVYLDSKILLEDEFILGHMVLRHPEVMLRLFSKALQSRQEHLLSSSHYQRQIEAGVALTLKKNVHGRVNWLPGANRKPNISSLRSIDVNAFVQFSGTVTRSSAVRVLEAVRVFECNNENCSGVVRVFACKYEVGNMVEKPTGKCPTCNRCSSYTELKEKHVCHDYQELKVQEQVQKLGMGSIPRSITVLLLHDLVDKCKAGDDVVITGVPIHRWSATYVDERCSLETVIEANTVQIVNAASQGVILTDEIEAGFRRFWRKWRNEKLQPIRGRNLIVGSICPQLYGLFIPKLAVALALAGCPTFEEKGTKVRGEPHLLMVGDPGTGKSQFLRFAAKLAPRSVLTTGTGTTSAGLTCSAVKEGHEFLLEAGALVLADRGICCIDEFGSMRQHDRATIHEAMEQQTLSVAKAGLVCTLKTRTTIIAATNPKGQFDPEQTLSANTGIAAPLLSRFDMVLVMLDKADMDWDRTVSEFILRQQAGLPKTENNGFHITSQDSTQQSGCSESQAQREQQVEKKGFWDVDTFQAYLAYIKRFQPKLTPEAATILSTYYKAQRGRINFEAGRTTLRLLESLIRIAKTHARLMARENVAIIDAIVSVEMVELSLSSMDNGEITSREGFPQDPDETAWDHTRQILNELGLKHLIPVAEDQLQYAYMPNTQAQRDLSQASERIKHMGEREDGVVSQSPSQEMELTSSSEDEDVRKDNNRNRDRVRAASLSSDEGVCLSSDEGEDYNKNKKAKKTKRAAFALEDLEAEIDEDAEERADLPFLTQANSLFGGQKSKKRKKVQTEADALNFPTVASQHQQVLRNRQAPKVQQRRSVPEEEDDDDREEQGGAADFLSSSEEEELF